MKKRIEKFLEMSKLVGNKNIVVDEAGFERLLSEKRDGFDFVKLNSIDGFDKDFKVGKEGIGRALVEADYAIAETGTVVVESRDENFRRATSLCDELFVVVRSSKIVNKLEDIANFMKEQTGRENYISFITGASRTADIEMSLTLGVHGPRDMTIFLIEESQR